jgi:hypothetical protein
MDSTVRFDVCEVCGRLMIFQGPYPQPHKCEGEK